MSVSVKCIWNIRFIESNCIMHSHIVPFILSCILVGTARERGRNAFVSAWARQPIEAAIPVWYTHTTHSYVSHSTAFLRYLIFTVHIVRVSQERFSALFSHCFSFFPFRVFEQHAHITIPPLSISSHTHSTVFISADCFL